jgi:superfamily I DNA and RNA helicase
MLIHEAAGVSGNEFALDFRYPTAIEIPKLKRIHRDLPADEQEKLGRDLDAMREILERIEEGDLSPDSLPADIRKLLRNLAREG